jgi:hypothetical protein
MTLFFFTEGVCASHVYQVVVYGLSTCMSTVLFADDGVFESHNYYLALHFYLSQIAQKKKLNM